jgi:hypothetical protein
MLHVGLRDMESQNVDRFNTMITLLSGTLVMKTSETCHKSPCRIISIHVSQGFISSNTFVSLGKKGMQPSAASNQQPLRHLGSIPETVHKPIAPTFRSEREYP